MRPKAAPVFLIALYHRYWWIFLIYSLYIPYIYIYFLNMFHIFSLVCFFIHSVNRRQVLIAKPRLWFLSRFYAFYLLLAIFSSLIKMNHLSNKIVFYQKNLGFLGWSKYRQDLLTPNQKIGRIIRKRILSFLIITLWKPPSVGLVHHRWPLSNKDNFCHE